MSEPNTAPPLAGQVLGGGGAFVIAEWRDAGGHPSPPGEPWLIAPLHLHRNDDEAWYVLEGRLCVRVGEEIVEANAGSAVFVPRDTPHTYWNPDEAPVRYLLVMTPNIHALIQDIHAMKERTPDAVRAVFERHDSVLL
jgi:mannose-6-phosphate isomerase-like protein (cupin superfamily)